MAESSLKFLHGDLVTAKSPIEYEAASGRKKNIRPGTHGVLVKDLGSGRYWAYFHGHPLIVLSDTVDIKRRRSH